MKSEPKREASLYAESSVTSPVENSPTGKEQKAINLCPVKSTMDCSDAINSLFQYNHFYLLVVLVEKVRQAVKETYAEVIICSRYEPRDLIPFGCMNAKPPLSWKWLFRGLVL